MLLVRRSRSVKKACLFRNPRVISDEMYQTQPQLIKIRLDTLSESLERFSLVRIAIRFYSYGDFTGSDTEVKMGFDKI